MAVTINLVIVVNKNLLALCEKWQEMMLSIFFL